MENKWMQYLLVPVAAMVFGSILSIGLASIHVTYVPSGPPFNQNNTVESGIYNVLIVIMLMIIMTGLIYAMVRYGKIRLFTAVKAALITIMVFSMILFFMGIFSYQYGVFLLYNAFIFYALAIVVSAIIVYCALIREGVCSVVSITLYSSMAGTILSITFPPLTLLILPAALAIYDIFMVYKGLLGKLVESNGNEEKREKRNILKGLMVDLGDLGIGVGDLVVYSMISSLDVISSIHYGSFAAFLTVLGSIVGVSIGFVLTIKVLLPKRGYAPALPIPVALGLIPFIITILL
ncbi:MAG: hypothetical protein RXQ96_03000 [Thermocladium sp.]|jgi:presenilin-like A22 family membrane protease